VAGGSDVLRALFLLHVLVMSSGSWAAEPPPFTVILEGERLSVAARGATLQEVLAEISRQGGFQLHTEAAVTARLAREPVNASFSDLSVEEGLRRLLGADNLVFIYSQARLEDVQVYAAGSRREWPVTKRAASRKISDEPQTVAVKSGSAEGSAAQPVQKSMIPERAPEPTDDADPALRQEEALSHPDPSRRSAALEGVAGTGDERLARYTAVAVLERERDEGVRETALGILLDLESTPLDVIARLAAAEQEPEPFRVRALQLLADRGGTDSRVVALLEGLARSDAHEDVRESATALLQDLRQE
jgi:hypothetical protein